ncbi:MAG: hypothetical protein R6U78_05140 [Bacteroidales bacterium]
MRKPTVTLCLFLVMLALAGDLFPQVYIEPGDPPNRNELPGFFRSDLAAIEEEVKNVKKGQVEVIARSPGGWPVYAVYYGEKKEFYSRANYNSAVAARDHSCYVKRDSSKPVVFLLGPVHGQEVEGIVGLVNLLHIVETGKDCRGREWNSLKSKFERCRVIIVPCGNPDGRRRCPYDAFVGLPVRIMTKYGQGTRKDGTLWGWPGAKSLHPMKGDVGILGAYFNDEGINMMHDDFFSPMAEETRAILDIARSEAPEITVSLHSFELTSRIIPTHYVPWFMKVRIDDLTRQLNRCYEENSLPWIPDSSIRGPSVEDRNFPPVTSFNLVSALHHVSGTMAFVFECSHGTLSEEGTGPDVSYGDILDMQLILYEKMFDYIMENRLL